MAEEWHADIQITEELVTNCIQAQFPQLLPIKTIKLLGEGWDNKVFLLNEAIIFRLPRRKIAVELLERENKVLTKLPPFLHINIPLPQYIGYPTDQYPYPFQGYELIKGISGYQAELEDKDRIASLPVLAHFLKQLHSYNETEAKAMGAAPQVFDHMARDKMIAKLAARVNKVISRQICDIKEDIFQKEIAIAQHLKLPTDQQCLVHGDLDCRHLIFNNKQLTGIIDWGDLGINHPVVDLDIVWSFYPQSCHAQFFAIYGEVDAVVWQYARFLGLYAAFTLMLYGHSIGDIALVNETVNAIKRININLLATSTKQ